MRLLVGVFGMLTQVVSSVSFGQPSIVAGLMVLIFAVTEEVGWRGFALPRLLQHHNPLVAALTLGVPWGLIHAGLTLPGLNAEGNSPVIYTLLIIHLSILLTWIFINTGKRLGSVILLHAAQSFFAFLHGNVPIQHQLWLMCLSYGAIALALVLLSGTSLCVTPAPQPASPVTEG
jgi:uncharacterized protein